MTVKKYY